MKATSDGKEGWVTVKGNQGTAYVEENKNTYICRHAARIESSLKVGSEALGELEVGETFELVEGPKTETVVGPMRIKCRSLVDCKEGWVNKDKGFKPWSLRHRCTKETELVDSPSTDGVTQRKLAVGEVVELVELPEPAESEEKPSFVRVCAELDSLVGYAAAANFEATASKQTGKKS